MSVYTVTIDYGTGAVSLTNYGGENLVRYKTIKKTQVLHKNYKSTVDTCDFSVNSKTILANGILTATDYITLAITKDATEYFTGVIRPSTGIRVNSANEYIDFKGLDNSYKLDNVLINSIGYYADKICDPGDTGNSIVHQLLLAAGYELADIGTLPTISDTILAFEEPRAKRTYFQILDDLILVYGWVFYFDDEGLFQMYEWAKDDAASTIALTSANMFNGVKLTKDDYEFDSVQLAYYNQGLKENKIIIPALEIPETAALAVWVSDRVEYSISSRPVEWPPDVPPPNFNIVGPGIPENFYEDYITQVLNETYNMSTQIEYATWGFVRTYTGLSVGDPGGPFTITAVDINDDGVEFTITNDEAVRSARGTIEMIGDYYYSISNNHVAYPALSEVVNYVNSIKIKNPWPYADLIAETFVQSYYKMKTAAVQIYEFGHTTDWNVGDYADITLSDVGVTAVQVRIIKKIITEQDARIKYIAEGIGTIGAITVSTVPIFIPEVQTTGQTQGTISVVENTLNQAGVAVPVDSNNIEALTPDQAGLYLASTEMGFHDGTNWTVYIKTDGTFKFTGDGSNYIEWDGATLDVYGDLFLSGSSTIQGSVAIGETLAVAGSLTVGTEITLDGTGGGEITVGTGVTLNGTAESIVATIGELGGWELSATTIESSDGFTIMDSANKRFEIQVAGPTTKVALGYLNGVEAYGVNDYGLYMAAGNTLRFEGGGEWADNAYTIQEDGALEIANGDGDIVARFGSVAAGTIGMVMGFAGGDIDVPAEKDRRVYVDNDEIGLQQYTAADWSTANSIKMGGVDSDTIFYPFIQCQGGISTLATEIDTEFLPTRNFHHLTFETNYDDQNGVSPDSTTDVARSNVWAKFGTWSLFATATDDSYLTYDDIITLTDSLGYLGWVNFTAIDTTWPSSLARFLYIIDVNNSLDVTVSYNPIAEELRVTFVEDVSGSPVQNITLSSAEITQAQIVSGSPWSIGCIVDFDNNKLYLIVNDIIYEDDIVALTLAGASTTNTVNIFANNGNLNNTFYQDDVIFTSDDAVSPDLFIQHYNNDRAWNTDISAEDYVIKAGPNGIIQNLSDAYFSGNVGIGTVTPDIQTWRTGTVVSISGSVAGQLQLDSSRADADSVALGSLQFTYDTNSATHKTIALIEALSDGATVNQRGGALAFMTKPNASATPTTKMFIDSAGNVGIGTTGPSASTLLDLTSTTGSLLLTRLTTTQRNALTPINGMILYNTTTTVIEAYENGSWVNL